MTTDPTPLQERLWDAIYASRSSSIDNEAPTIAIVAAVLPIIAAEVRKAQADALRQAAEDVTEIDGHRDDSAANWLRACAADIETED